MAKYIAGKEFIDVIATKLDKCTDCKHFFKDDLEHCRCKAFPDEIPDEVFWGNYEDECNNGIKFEED